MINSKIYMSAKFFSVLIKFFSVIKSVRTLKKRIGARNKLEICEKHFSKCAQLCVNLSDKTLFSCQQYLIYYKYCYLCSLTLRFINKLL